MNQGSFKVSKRSSKGVSMQFHRCFMEVSSVFKESIKCVSRKFLLSQGRNFGIYFRYMVSIDTGMLKSGI